MCRQLSKPVTILYKQPFTFAVSTCQSAIGVCESDQTCGDQLSHVRMRCLPSRCNSEECATAIRLMSRYVHRDIVKDMMFCRCAVGDRQCQAFQQLSYPACLYRTRSRGPVTCSDAVRECEVDAAGCG